ncbi:MAG: hypothetical protein GY865_09470 [candidate division Zixibacteria bacterium]|nr:hypothetical protein [candidate division Zixibacteria bacterium]
MKKAILSVTLLLLIISFVDVNAIDLSKCITYDVPEQEMERQFGAQPPSKLTRQDSLEVASYRFEGETFRVLTILVDWIDRPATHSAETIEEMMFSRNTYPGGSLADYFDEVSFGQIEIVGDVYGWHTDSYYPGANYNFNDLLYDLDPVIDYSQYDGDDDGHVDAIIFIRSGNGKEDTGLPFDIWSFAVYYPGSWALGPFDGVRVSRWCTAPETIPLRGPIDPTEFSGVDELNSISTAAHELTHNLGLPDLYDYDDKLVVSTFSTPDDNNDHPFVDWCLMGYNGYGLMAIKKDLPHICGWSKKELKWISPVILGEGEYTDLVINNIETTNENSLYQIPIGTSNEYFLLEYRNPQSSGLFDKVDSDFSVYLYPDLSIGADTLDRGLLITHVDGAFSTYSRFNNGTPEYPHYAVQVKDAGYNPARDATTNPLGHVTDSAQWWYPYETRKAALFSSEVPGQELFSPDTYPNSDGYDYPSGITVLVDSMVDEKLYAHVWVDPDMDDFVGDADNCPYDYNPEQTDSDGDGNGDPCDKCPGSDDNADFDADTIADNCDNCPNEPNTDQVDTDFDDLGDVCDNCPDNANSNQLDTDDDEVGDICDNCVYFYNPLQIDSDEDGIGDACGFVCGDANGDEDVNILDIVLLINFKYKNGTEPSILFSADVNKDFNIDILDIVLLINSEYKNGVEPDCWR